MSNAKFRCWDKFQKKYIFEGFHVVGEVTCFGGMEITIRDTWKERSKAMGYEHTIQAWNDFELEQYICLQDKNKKEICVGDILQEDCPRGNKYRIIQVPGGFAFNTFQDEIEHPDFWEALGDQQTNDYIQNHCTIVGNTKENPELLK